MKCVDSIRKSSYVRHQIVVLDNGSCPEEREKLKDLDSVMLLQSDRNLGFAGGNNKIAQLALDEKADFLWMVNSDASVERTAMQCLVEAAECHDRAGIFSPLILNENDHDVQHALTLISTSEPSIKETKDIDEASSWQAEMPDQVVVWGTAMFVRCSLIEKIGLFDDGLFAYMEDFDFCVRAMTKGLRSQLVPDARVYHHVHQGERKPHYYYYANRNSILFWRKHKANVVGLLRVLKWRFAAAKRTVRHSVDPNVGKAVVGGVIDGLLSRGGEFPAKKRATVDLITKVLRLGRLG